MLYFVIAVLFFGLGWWGHASQERVGGAKKRRRAIPKGTSGTNPPRKVKKPLPEPGLALAFGPGVPPGPQGGV